MDDQTASPAGPETTGHGSAGDAVRTAVADVFREDLEVRPLRPQLRLRPLGEG
jgi:hypothetical protein